MDFELAKKIINNSYSTIQFSLDIEIISINKYLNFSHGYFIALINNNGVAELTDMGKTSEALNLTKTALSCLCKKHNLSLSNWVIEKNFEDIKDLENFIALLDEVAETEQLEIKAV